jgi:hypothetical protein
MNETIKYILTGWCRIILAWLAGYIPALAGADSKLIETTASVIALAIIMGVSAWVKVHKAKQQAAKLQAAREGGYK